MSWLVNALTPKNTEEVRPGLFIQTLDTARGKSYRKITPAAWDGKINWKTTLLGASPIKFLFIFLTLMLVSYGFYQGTSSCVEFQEDPCKHLNNITAYCSEIDYYNLSDGKFNFIEGDYGKKDTNSLSNIYP